MRVKVAMRLDPCLEWLKLDSMNDCDYQPLAMETKRKPSQGGYASLL